MAPIVLEAPLPGGRKRLELTWMAGRRRAAADRASASHARLVSWDLDDRRREEDLDLTAADALLAEAAAIHARRDRARAAAVGREDERAAVAATLDLGCSRCGVDRAYAGRLDLVTSERPEHLGHELTARARLSTVALHRYACPRCGSTELFDGRLPHPVR